MSYLVVIIQPDPFQSYDFLSFFVLGLKDGSWSYFDLQGNVLREKVPLKEIRAEYDWQLDILSQPTNRELELSLLFVMAQEAP